MADLIAAIGLVVTVTDWIVKLFAYWRKLRRRSCQLARRAHKTS